MVDLLKFASDTVPCAPGRSGAPDRRERSLSVPEHEDWDADMQQTWSRGPNRGFVRPVLGFFLALTLTWTALIAVIPSVTASAAVTVSVDRQVVTHQSTAANSISSPTPRQSSR